MNRKVRYARLFLLMSLVTGAILLPLACMKADDHVAPHSEFSGTTDSCGTPDYHVCTADEVNTDACPYDVEVWTQPDTDSEGGGGPDSITLNSTADYHELQLADGLVAGDNVTPLSGIPAYNLRHNISDWRLYHWQNDLLKRSGFYNADDGVVLPWDESDDPTYPYPTYTQCPSSVDFNLEVPGDDVPGDLQYGIDNQDCWSMAYGTGQNVKQYLEDQGDYDSHVLVKFPAVCPHDDTSGGTAARPSHRFHTLASRTSGGHGALPMAPPPPTNHPNQQIFGRTFSNFTIEVRPAWDAAARVQENRATFARQLFADFPAGSTIDIRTDVLIGGTGPGGGVLAANYGEHATMISPEVGGWATRVEYAVTQAQLSVVDFVPAGLPNRDLLTTVRLISTVHSTPGVVQGYQPAMMDLVMANSTRFHYPGRVTRYGVRQNAGRTELVLHTEVTHPTEAARPYQFAIGPGKIYFDATGPTETPRVRMNRLDTRVPNQVGDPAITYGGRQLLNSGDVAAVINGDATHIPRNLNIDDTASLITNWGTTFNGTRVVVVGNGPAAFQTIGRLMARTNADIVVVHQPTEVANTRANNNVMQGEVLAGMTAFDANDPRIIKMTTTTRLSDINLINGMELQVVRVNPTTATIELRIPNVGSPRGDYVISCVGPIDGGIPADVAVMSSTRVVNAIVNGTSYPLYVRAVDGQLVFDGNSSRKFARLVTDYNTRHPGELGLPADTIRDLNALGNQRDALMAELGSQSLYEFTARLSRMIYQNIVDGKTIWP